jgi:hypothetical protein
LIEDAVKIKLTGAGSGCGSEELLPQLQKIIPANKINAMLFFIFFISSVSYRF